MARRRRAAGRCSSKRWSSPRRAIQEAMPDRGEGETRADVARRLDLENDWTQDEDDEE